MSERKSLESWLGAGLLVAGLFGALGSAPAIGQETPKALPGGKVITAEEGKKLLDGKSVVFVDTRAVVSYGKGHVSGAVIAAYREKSDKVENFDASQDNFDMSKLPADKGRTIVFYSDGPGGWKSYKAATLAIRAGYKNVMYLRGGYAEWSSKGLPSES